MATTLKYTTPQVLTDEKWEFHHECACKVNKKYYYRHGKYPGIEIAWHVKQQAFKVTNRGMTMRGLTSLVYLPAVLKSLSAN